MIRSELAQMAVGVAIATILIAFPALAATRAGAAASTAAQQMSEGARATAALNLLEASGYHVFSNFHPAGRDFEATVTTKHGDRLAIIDPDRKLVTID